jgi:hypothetical protein
MDHRRVIVRAFGGRPLDRVAIGFKNGAFFIVRSDRIEAVESGDSMAVGFHAADVFEFDLERFSKLENAWSEKGATRDADWAGLTHLSNSWCISA